MTRLTGATLASIAVLIGVLGVLPAIYVIARYRAKISSVESLLLAAGITAALFIFAWIRIWARFVSWTPKRKTLTLMSVLWSTGVAIGVGIPVVFSDTRYSPDQDSIVIICVVWLSVWMLSTALIWTESDGERVLRLAGGTVTCPKCRYNLTGLSEARCPECGEAYTLDSLFAAQRGQDSG